MNLSNLGSKAAISAARIVNGPNPMYDQEIQRQRRKKLRTQQMA
jgi:hypothetical protein